MPRLDLRLLGMPEVWCGERRVSFSTRKSLALLTYLAAEGGEHSREQLIAFLWPESDSEHGRMSLRTTLARLRSAIGDSQATGPPVLLTRGDALAIDVSAVNLDLKVVQHAWEGARTGKVAEQLSALRQAAEQYRGDFLDGFSLPDAPDFDDWASAQRETWHHRMTMIFDRLAHSQFEGGDRSGTLETVGRWITMYPLDEAAHRLRMLALFTGGDRSGALAAFERCQAILSTELDAEPSPETSALANRLRHAPPPTVDDALDGPPDRVVPLVGREAQHARLVTEYRRTLRGEPRVVVIEGEPGIGKTRLAREFLHWVRAQGPVVLWGRAVETLDGLPYHPLTEALRPHLDGDQGIRALLDGHWLAELGRLFPEIGASRPARSQDEGEGRTRLSAALAQAALALGRKRPVVWFLDDLQWADAATFDVLQHAIHTWSEGKIPLLLVLALRSDDAGTPSILDWLLHLARAAPLERLQLQPLDRTDALQIIEALVPGVNEETRTRLLSDAAGQPLYLIETIRSLLEGADAEEAIPPGVQAIIEQRLARLGKAARTLMTAAAVLGHEIVFDRLRVVAGIDEEKALAACEEIASRGLLRPHGGSFLFPHDRIREVAYVSASEMRRRVFHRRALDVLEQEGAPALELSRHARAAELAGRAFELTVAAGDDALRLYAVRDAIALYRQARSLLSEAGEVPLSRRGHLAQQLGRACELAGQAPGAKEAYEEMLVLARSSGDAAMEGAALNGLAGVATLTKPDLPLALALLRQALVAAERGRDRRGLAETLCRIAQIQFFTFDLDQALPAGLRGLDEAKALGDARLLARIQNGLAYIAMGLGRWGEVEEYAAAARALYAGMGDRTGETDSMLLMAEARIRWCRPAEAAELCRRAVAIHQEIGSVLGDFSGTLTFVHALLDCGLVDEAVRCAEEGLQHARTFGIPPHLIFTLCALGTARRAAGDVEVARALHQEALELTRRVPHPPFLEIAASEACADCVRTGNWEEATRFARTALEERTGSWPHYTGRTRWLETASLLRAGDEKRAAEDVRIFGERLSGDLRYRISYLRAASVLAAWQSDSVEAARLYQEGDAIARELDITLEPLCSPI